MAAQPMSHSGSSHSPVNELIDGLHRDESSARWKAAKDLSLVGQDAQSAIPDLIEVLSDRNIIVRVGAAETLGRLGAAAILAVPALIECLRDRYATVRETAAAALGAIGPHASAAIDVMWHLLSDENKYVRSETERAIVKLCSDRSSKSLETLTPLLGHSSPGVRAGIARSLGGIGASDSTIITRMTELLKDEDSTVKLAAAEALMKLCPESRAAILVLTDAIDHADFDVRARARSILDGLVPGALKGPEFELQSSDRPADHLPRVRSSVAGSDSDLVATDSPCTSLAPVRSSAVSDRLWRIPTQIVLGKLPGQSLYECVLRLWVPVPCALVTESAGLSVKPSRLARGPHEVVLSIEPRVRAGQFHERIRLSSPSQTRWILVECEIEESSRQSVRPTSLRAVVWQPPDWNRIVYDTRMKDLARLRERGVQHDQTGSFATHPNCIENQVQVQPASPIARLDQRDPSWAMELPGGDRGQEPAVAVSGALVHPGNRQTAKVVTCGEARFPEAGYARRKTPALKLVGVLALALLAVLTPVAFYVYYVVRNSTRPVNDLVPRSTQGTIDPAPSIQVRLPSNAEIPPAVVNGSHPDQPGQTNDVASGPQPVINSIGMRLIRVETTRFMMGSEEGPEPNSSPAHLVEFTHPILVGQFEVTQGEWHRVMGTGSSSWFNADRLKVSQRIVETYPVDSVSWFDAVRFCNRLSEREHLDPYYQITGSNVRILSPDAPGYRLPTEAEWEFCCKGGKSSRWFFGDRLADLEEFANYAANSREQTHPVGSKRSNPFGLYDLYGNVAEWCWDWMGDYAKEPLIDPTGPKSGRYRVLRGGAWDTYESDISCVSRSSMLPEKPNRSNGFRVVRYSTEHTKN